MVETINDNTMKRLMFIIMAFGAYATTNAQSLNYYLRSQIPTVSVKDGKKITTVEIRRQVSTAGGNFTMRTVTFQGSPFFFDNYATGTFSVDGGKTSITAPVLLNLTTDEILAKVDGKIVIYEKIPVNIDGHEFVSIDGRYYELLVSGKVNLLKRYSRQLEPFIVNNVTTTSGYGSDKFFDGQIISEEIYYLGFHDNQLREIKMTPKSVINALTKENKSHFVNGDFERMNENDALIKAVERLNKIDEKELIKIMEGNAQAIIP
jgi:hypothetical protein